MRFRAIIRNFNVLNVVLLAVIVGFAAYILPPLLNVQSTYAPPAAKKTPEVKEEKPAAQQMPSAIEYTVVAEQNLFNPERKIPTEKKSEKEKELAKPDFVLFGTVITGDTSVALLEDRKAPYSSPGRGKRQRTLHLGSVLSGYTLREVHPDMVVMTRGDERIELKVIDGSKAKLREGEAVAAAQQGTARGKGAAVKQSEKATVNLTERNAELSKRREFLRQMYNRRSAASGSSRAATQNSRKPSSGD